MASATVREAQVRRVRFDHELCEGDERKNAAQLGAALLLAHDAADADVEAAVEAPAQLILSPREAVDQDGGKSGCARIEETARVVERRAHADVQEERRLELTR